MIAHSARQPALASRRSPYTGVWRRGSPQPSCPATGWSGGIRLAAESVTRPRISRRRVAFSGAYDRVAIHTGQPVAGSFDRFSTTYSRLISATAPGRSHARLLARSHDQARLKDQPEHSHSASGGPLISRRGSPSIHPPSTGLAVDRTATASIMSRATTNSAAERAIDGMTDLAIVTTQHSPVEASADLAIANGGVASWFSILCSGPCAGHCRQSVSATLSR